MKRLFLFLALLAFAHSAEAACSGSSPDLTAPTWDDVAACHTSASNGATITVTAGSYTVTTTTTITKHVTIICSGVCTLTDNTADVGDLINITESTAGHTRLEGFTFVQGTGNHSNPNGVIRLENATNGLGILLTGNTYNLNGSGTGDFIIAAVNRGVIWDNTINNAGFSGGSCNNNANFVRHKPLALGGVWTEVPYYGDDDTNGDKNLYIETNTITGALEGIDIDENGRAVVRFNTITNAGLVNHGVDTGDIGGRSIDAYGNTWVWDTTVECAPDLPAGVTSFIYLRGGPGLFHSNVIPDVNSMAWGDKPEVNFAVENLTRNAGSYGCWTGGYPSVHQVGWGYSTGGTQADATGVFQDLEPVLVFANTGAGNYGTPAKQDFNPDQCMATEHTADYVVENRDYYLDKTATFNGTVGIGSGDRTSRPSTCTAGVAWWSTDQGGNWNTTGGDANDGALDKCTATNTWTNDWYIPKTYPHPLIGATESGSTTTGSGSRTRLRVR